MTRLFWYTFLTFFGTFQLLPTAPLRLAELGAAPGATGLFSGLFGAGASLGALATGRLSDRLGHARTLLIAALGLAAVAIAFGVTTSPTLLVSLGFVHGVLFSATLAGGAALAATLAPPDSRTRALARYGLASPAGSALGPPAGIFVATGLGFPALALSLAVTFLLLAALASRMPRAAGVRGQLSWRPPEGLLSPALVLGLVALAFGGYTAFTAREGLREGLAFPSAFLTALGVGMIASRLLVHRFVPGTPSGRHVVLALTVASLGGILFATLPSGLLRHALSGCVFGLGYALVFTFLNVLVSERVAKDRLGTAFGTLNAGFDAGVGFGSAALGWALAHLGPRAGFGAAAVALLLALSVAALTTRSASGLLGHSNRS